MSRAVAVLAILLLTGAVQADTITVIGLVASQATGEPRPGVEVGLYCDVKKGCQLGVAQATTDDGLYALTKSNINVTKVYVIYDGTLPYTADPVLVPVNCPGGAETCVLKAKKLLLQSLPLGTDTRAAARRINAFGNTQSVKVWAGVIDADKANEATAREAAKVLGLATGIQKSDPGKTLDNVFDMIRELPTPEGLPKLKVLSDHAEFRKVKEHTEFGKLKDLSMTPELQQKKDVTAEDKIRYFLALPDAHIDKVWVADKKHTAFVADFLKINKADSSAQLHFRPKEKLTTAPNHSPPVFDAVLGTDAHEIQAMLGKAPELRAWTFYELMLRDNKVPASFKPLVADRVESLRPTVVAPRK